MLIPRALDELLLIDDLLDDFVVDLFTVAAKVLLAHLSLLLLERLNVLKFFELFIHLDGDAGEDVEHHCDDNVENDPLHEYVEDHEVDARPALATCTTHHVRDSWPVIDNHEGVEGHNCRAEVIEVDEVVKVVGNTVLAVEPWLLDVAAQAVNTPNSRNVEDNIEAGELVEKRSGHFHDHLHDHLELFALLEQAGDSQVSHHEGKR